MKKLFYLLLLFGTVLQAQTVYYTTYDCNTQDRGFRQLDKPSDGCYTTVECTQNWCCAKFNPTTKVWYNSGTAQQQTDYLIKQQLVNENGIAKRKETYSGITLKTPSNLEGTYTVVFSTPYNNTPNIQANIINGIDSQNVRIISISNTGFTVLVRNRLDVVGLLPTWVNASGVTVDVLINEK